ncbi:MAG: septation protein SepH, partial [Lapillicoccus sp.]
MQDLRLIGVNEDGLHLLLAGAAGERFRVPLDDALRAAARQDRPRLGQLQIEMEGGLRPRDIQAMVRAGASAEDVAERAGWTVEKVRKYEGPILAERAHVADLARGVRLRTRGGGTGGASTLSTRVADRMRARGVDAETSSWDAWKLPETQHWTVALSFAAGGRQRRASWSFDLTSRVVDAEDDEARWLSEEEAAAGPIPGSDAGAGPADVYDVEAEGGVVERRRGSSHAASGQGASGQGASGQGTSGRPTRSRAAERGAEGEEPLDLMTAMRERSGARGRRTGRRKTPASAPTSPPTSPTALPGDPGRTDALP